MRIPASYLEMLIVVLLTALATPAIGHGQSATASRDSSVLLRGRHGITLHAGFLNQATTETGISGGSVSSETRTTGFLGWLSYAYWVRPDWSVGLSVGVINAEASSSVEAGAVTSVSAVVVPLVFGAAYYPAALAISPSLRPYGSLAIGPYLGFATNSRVGGTVVSESVSEAAIGLRAQAGVDLFFAKWFKTGIVVGYHFVSDFEEQIGSDKNYSGPEFSVGFGILLGGSR